MSQFAHHCGKMQCAENYSRSRIISLLREFFDNYSAIASDTFSQLSCAKLLIRIATASEMAFASNTCLIYTRRLCTLAHLEQNTWNEFAMLLIDGGKVVKSLCHRPAVYASLLALFELAIVKGLEISHFVMRIDFVAEGSLQSNDQNNRIAAIKYFVTSVLKARQQCSVQKWLWLEKLLLRMTEDYDSRVRIAAIKGLSAMAASDRQLSFCMYQQIKNLCGNSSRTVRKEALFILRVFADHMPETEVTGRNGAELRLVDDAFATVCHAVNDVEVTVRAAAARLLGDFRQVSDSFLDQTLDKKLLNAMRMAKNRDNASKRPHPYGYHHRRSQPIGGWSTGRKLGGDVPVERFDEEQASIISSGACGAFVTALEDEFMIVRQAGVYSLGRLAADRPFLAAVALDYLADMFNDEIEQVRLDAVKALTPLVVHGILQKEQLDAILTVLDDALPDSREALRVILSNSTLGTPDCLRYVVKALLSCMKRFPIDRESVFRCMSELGRRHAPFVQLLSDELLELHPVFNITEPGLDDRFYLAKLILILNAASVHDPICSLLPAFAVRHYKFLRCSMPFFVPAIHAFLDDSVPSIDDLLPSNGLTGVKERICSLLERTYELTQEASLARTYHQRMIEKKALLKDMDASCEADEAVASTVQFLSYVLKILMQCEQSMQILSYGGSFQTALSAIDEGLGILDCVDSNFSSVDKVMLAALEEFRFQFSVLRLAVLIDTEPASFANAVQSLKAEVDHLKEQLRLLGMPLSGPAFGIIVDLERLLEESEAKKFISGSKLIALFRNHAVKLPPKFASLGGLYIKWVQVVEPTEISNEPMRFVVGLPLAISVNAVLHNFNENDIIQFRIKIDYPNQSISEFRPRKKDFKEIAPHTYRLLCEVLVQVNRVWSSPGRVRLGCVLKSKKLAIRDSARLPFIPIAESPCSEKQATIEVPIQPVLPRGIINR